MDRDIRKVSWDGKRVLVRYEISRPGGVDELELSCVEAPGHDLLAALRALRDHVAQICELSKPYCADLEIRGASFSYGGDDRVMGATITALKKLRQANAPLVINTPHLASRPYSDNEDGNDKLLPDETTTALECLMDAALRYVDGQRAQHDLFLTGEIAGAGR